MTPRVGTKVWFGPRRFGWGWDAVSVEGWVVGAVAIAAIVGPIPFIDEDRSAVPFLAYTAVAVAGLLLVCALKGTSPGGPSAYRSFREQQQR